MNWKEYQRVKQAYRSKQGGVTTVKCFEDRGKSRLGGEDMVEKKGMNETLKL